MVAKMKMTEGRKKKEEKGGVAWRPGCPRLPAPDAHRGSAPACGHGGVLAPGTLAGPAPSYNSPVAPQ